MDERLAYPAAAMRWNINAEHHDYAATVFQAIVTANGFSVLGACPRNSHLTLDEEGQE